jgi:hypothetical protein
MQPIKVKLPGTGSSGMERGPAMGAGTAGGPLANIGKIAFPTVKPMIKSWNDFKNVHFGPQQGLRINLK